MGTRSDIGVQNENGTVTFIYCHWDSYPSHHIPLLKGYPTLAMAQALVAPGDVSSLDETVGEKHDFDARPRGQCNYYGRDRGEKGTEPREAATVVGFEKAATNGYAYLFRDGEWWWREGGDWKKAADWSGEESGE